LCYFRTEADGRIPRRRSHVGDLVCKRNSAYFRSSSDILTVMRVIERPFSDLLRHPKEVAGEVEDGDVLLRRRDEPDLRLTRADRDAERSAAFAALGRALRNVAIHEPKLLGTALVDAFPWLEVLPSNDRKAFVDEFSRVVVAASELDSYALLTQVVREWRATAEIYADPGLARRLAKPIHANGERVPRPAR
jgi:hypothetical protein